MHHTFTHTKDTPRGTLDLPASLINNHNGIALFIMGCAGSGKGTLSEALHQNGLFPQIIVSDHLRPYKYCADLMAKGELNPAKICVHLTESEIFKHLMVEGKPHYNIALDGATRNVEQAVGMFGMLVKCGYLLKDIKVVELEVSDAEAVIRIKDRAQKTIAEGKTARPDDLNDAAILRRLHIYKEHQAPINNLIKAMGIIIHHVETSNKTKDEVYNEVVKLIG